MENISNWILICAFLVGVLLILLIIGTTVCLGKSFGFCKKIRGRRISPAYERNQLSSSHVENEAEAGKGQNGRRLFRYKRPKFARKVNRNQIYWLSSGDDREPIATVCSSKDEYVTPTTTKFHEVVSADQDMLIVDADAESHVPLKKLLNFDKTSLTSTGHLNTSPTASNASRLDDVVIKQQQKKAFGSNRWSFHSFHSASLNSYAPSLTPIKAGAGDRDQLLLDQDQDADSYDQRVSQAGTLVEGSLLDFQKVKNAIDNIVTETIDRTPVHPNDRDSILNLNYPCNFASQRQTDPANISVSDAFLKALSDNRVQVSRDSRKKSIFSKVEIDSELVNF